ncbi:MAG: CoA transferase [Rhizobiaceae bacterium]|nr:CoA transferase [Rhizobiaceae bacterium]
MAGALEGILVVTLEQAVAAPLASARLADAGARVIKLERPEGDFARAYDAFALGQSSYFVWINRGKESCTVDLKNPSDLALVRRILAGADVFIQNLAPGATARLGLGSEELRREFPRLTVCDISGFGHGSPDHDRKSYDLLVQAETGLAGVTGSEASGATRVGVSVSDISTGQAAYSAILEALFARERTGRGRHIQLSLFDTLAEFMNVPYLTHRYGGKEPPRIGLAHPSIAPYGVFHALDGDVLIAIQNEREWAVFRDEVLGDPAMASDPRFTSNNDRVKNRPALDGLVQEFFDKKSVAEMIELLDRSRIAYGRVSTMAELQSHRSLATTDVQTPAGPVALIAPTAIVDGKRPELGRVPSIGEHSEAIRAEFAPKL